MSCEKAKLSGQIAVSINPNLIEIPYPEGFLGVKADSRMLPEQLTANGGIAQGIGRTVAINVLGRERVAGFHAKPGDSVKKGQLLLKMHSPDLANGVAALKQARANEFPGPLLLFLVLSNSSTWEICLTLAVNPNRFYES